jgi:predicted AAA+ superfamily ATPase
MSELIKWKDKKGRKPLLLEGARQVGKTYLLKDFGKRYLLNISLFNVFLCEQLLDYSNKILKSE